MFFPSLFYRVYLTQNDMLYRLPFRSAMIQIAASPLKKNDDNATLALMKEKDG